MPVSVRSVFKGWWDVIVVGSGIVASIVGLYEPLRDRAAEWALQHCLPAAPQACVAREFSGAGALAAAILVLGALGVLLAYTVLSVALPKGRVGRVRVESTGTIHMLERTFKKTVEATDLIASQLFPGVSATHKDVRSFKQVWVLGKDGDCRVTQTWKLAAQNGDLHFFETGIQGDDQTRPAGFPDEIGLQVDSKTSGKRVAWLLSRNELTEKDFVVFLLPAIESGGTDTREVAIQYSWRGLMRKLALERSDYFEYSIKSAGPIPSVEYQFRTEGGAGPLKCEIDGPLLGPNERIEMLKDDAGEYWKYTVAGMPSGHPTKIRLRFD